MTAPEDDRGRELVPDAWRELDDSLADGPAPAEVPAEARAWLADQRTMHGLLRALHTQDAAAREGRIEAILARIADEPRIDPHRRWFLVAAAALLLATLGFWLALPASLPTAEAAVQRVMTELSRDVARRYRVVGTPLEGAAGFVGRSEFSLVAQPGGRFVVEGRVGPLGMSVRCGCDGQEMWVVSMNGAFKHAMPIAERERMMEKLGNSIEFGYLDVNELVRVLAAEFDLAVTRREVDAAGRRVLRVEGTRKPVRARAALRKVWLQSDEATGMVTRLEGEIEAPFGRRRLTLEYLGDEPLGLVEFHRPW